MITLQFVGGDGVTSDLIEWFSAGSPVSHVDQVLPDGRLLGARCDVVAGVPSGVRIRPANYGVWKTVIRARLFADDAVTKVFAGFTAAQLGKPYDMVNLVADFLASRDWRNPDAWWCSELQGAALEACRWFPRPLMTPDNKLAPGTLLTAISARSDVVITRLAG